MAFPKMTFFVPALLISSLLFSGISAEPKEVDNAAAIQDEMGGFFETQLQKSNLAAIAALITKDDQVQWVGFFGHKDIENGSTVDQDTVFHTGSLSKTITATAFLILWEEKGYSLDADINRFLPFSIRNPRFPLVAITPKMLLTHTSSLNDVNINQQNNKVSSLYGPEDRDGELESTLKEILLPKGKYYHQDFFLAGEPGTQYQYSNLAFSILGLLVEKVAGKPFNEYCKEFIFSPLGMDSSTFLLSETDRQDFANLYSRDRSEPSQLMKVEPFTWPGYMDGSFRTTALDYSRFLIMMMNFGKLENKQVLSGKAVRTVLELQDLPGRQSTRMFIPAGRAIVWNRVKIGDLTVFHFNGMGPTFFTEAFFDPDTGIAGLFFTTGEFVSFPQMGEFIHEVMNRMTTAACKDF